MNERESKSNYDEYRPISTEVRSDCYGLPTKKGTKGICLCKQETYVEDSSRTLVSSLAIFTDLFEIGVNKWTWPG
jgi:hypothetical protein